jgi:hypothetical protein
VQKRWICCAKKAILGADRRHRRVDLPRFAPISRLTGASFLWQPAACCVPSKTAPPYQVIFIEV